MGLKSELVFFSKSCYNNKFVAAADGNLSIRTPKDFILSTPSGKCKGRLKESDIVKTDLSGKLLKAKNSKRKKKPSTEIKLHAYIYTNRKDINAVVHTHPKFATAFAAAGIALDKIVLPEIYLMFKKIPLAKYGTPSTDELPESISPFVKDYNAILLANHGLVTFAKTLEEAYYLTEKVEQFAEISYYAMTLGGEKVLTKAQINKLNGLKIY